MVERETHNTEFKLEWQDEYLRWICGFANAHGGVLYIGVDDKGRVVGLSNAKRLMEDIPNKVKNTMGLALDISLLNEGGKEYIEVVIPRVSYPISYKGEYHYRSGATKQQLTGNELTRFIIRRTGYQWDAEPMPNVSINELDKESFDIFCRESQRRSRLEKEDLALSREELLSKLELLTDDGQLTRAAVLLFHRTPEKFFSGAYIKVGQFRGPDIMYMDEVHGSLMMQDDRILDLIYTKYMYMHISYFEDRVRMERYAVPQLAMREALYNALMHTDYAQINPIQVRIDEGCVRIANSAQVPEGWTAETFLSPHESKPYNRNIARVFFRAGFVETWGRGIEKMCITCTNEGMGLPRYTVFPTTVTLEFDKMHLDESRFPAGKLIEKPEDEAIDTGKKEINNTGKTRYKKYCKSDGIDAGLLVKNTGKKENGNTGKIELKKQSEYALPILRLIFNQPNTTIQDICQATGLSLDAAYYQIRLLKKKGVLKRVGSGRNGHWEIIEYTSIIK